MLLSQSKLDALVEAEGFVSLEEMLESTMADSVSPGICTNPSCSYTCDTEPDQDAGWCEECGTNSVKSALILAHLI